MRLSQFVLSNLDAIVDQWQAFAATILPQQQYDRLILRNQAEEILKAIALQMEIGQSEAEQITKSEGRAARQKDDTFAESHGEGRLRIGFNVAQMVSEFRALRATVIRLWMATSPELDASAADQLIRFNEEIDRAVAESTQRFMQELEKSRDFAIAVLAHDLRNPLNAIVSSAQMLLIDKSLAGGVDLYSGIIQSGVRMDKLIHNLLDFTRVRLGQPIPLKRESLNVLSLCREIVAEFVAAWPEYPIELSSSGDVIGTWDGSRIKQLLSNLIANGVQHGTVNGRVTVDIRSEGEEVVIRVHNEGLPITSDKLSAVFDPFVPFSRDSAVSDGVHLGIGLYVAREIVRAHSGKITVSSTRETGTTFVVSLPRQPN
jgi:signal transduction histidine kinase